MADYVSQQEVEDTIKSLQVKKTEGLDGIKNLYLKNLPRSRKQFLTFIVNSCLKLQYFPDRWKIAKVIPIPKPGKPSEDPNSYRPISLLSSLSKIF